jgi:multiple sugar transport system substrate-binding protein
MSDHNLRQRLAMAEAARQVLEHRSSRREFLRTCGLLGLGWSAARWISGCRRRGGPAHQQHDIESTMGPRSAGDSRTEQHRFLKEVGRAFAGTRLRVVGEDTPPTRATIELMKHEFTPLTGIDVTWEQLPLDRVLAKVLADTGLRAGVHDVFYWDQAWIGRLIDDAIDPSTLLARADLAYPDYDFDDFLPPLIKHVSSYKGRLGGVPFDIPVWIMMYRRDILEELGLRVPTTIPEYLEVARAITAAKGPRVYGTVEGWKAGHYSLLQKSTTWLWGHGGSFFGADEEPTIDDEQAAAGMAFMLALGGNMPPEATTWDWTGEATSFARGRAGLYIGIGEFFPTYDDPASSSIVGLTEAAPAPRPVGLRSPAECGFDETPGMSHHGGSSLVISRYSRHVEAAWIFLQWATSSDVTTRASLLGGGSSPIRRSNYEDPRIKRQARVGPGTTRHFAVTLDAIMNHLGTEPHLPAWSELSIAFAVQLGKMTTGQQSLRESLDNMAAAARRATARRE